MKASLACLAGKRVHLIGREHLEVVNFDRAAVRAGKAEARSFRGFVKVHKHLAFTKKETRHGLR